MVSNLLGNALTHGDASEPVRVEAFTHDGWLDLSLANTGTPIPAAMIERSFEPFARGEHRSSLQGLGLGLYISHQIAVAHGGTLEVVSTKAETRFTFKAMDHDITTLAPSTVVRVPRDKVLELTRRPDIARALWWTTLVDEATLRAALVNLGQRNAEERIAHLLCELICPNVGYRSGRRWKVQFAADAGRLG